jgi:RHS repeat-associated protein
VVDSTYFGDETLRTIAEAGGGTTTLSTSYPGGGGRVETITGPPRSGINATVARTVRTYDALGDLITVVEGDPALPAELATTTFNYDGPIGGVGRAASETSPTGVVTRYGYDNDGRITQVTRGAPLGTPANTWTYEWDKRGRITKELGPTGDVDGNGNPIRTQYAVTYDDADRITKTVEGTGAAALATSYVFDSKRGWLNKVIVDLDGDAAPNDPGDRVTEYAYTNAGRLLQQYDPPVDVTSFAWNRSDPAVRRTDHTYNTAGDLATVTAPTGELTEYVRNSDGQVHQIRLGSSLWREYTYDAHGKVTSLVEAGPSGTGNSRELWTYNRRGLLESHAAPHDASATNAPTSSYLWNADGTLASVTNPLGGPNASVTHGYDSRGNQTSRTSWTQLSPGASPVQATETWAYNRSDQLILSRRPSETAANTGGTVRAYNSKGQLDTVTQRSGRATTFTYWNNGAVRLERSTGPGLATVDVTNWFDGRGRRTKLVDPTGTTTNTWDRAGNLTNTTAPPTAANPNPNYDYTWDLSGLPRHLTYPDGTTHSFWHDKKARIVQSNVVVSPGVEWAIVGYGYDSRGNRTNEIINTSAGTRTWNFPSNLSTEATKFTQTLNGTTTVTDLTHANTGLLETETTAGVTTTYAYDNANQLTSATRTGDARSWTYGPQGNRLTQTINGATTNYTYDIDGQLVADSSGRTYSWDLDGRRTTTTGGPTNTTTTYDARGLLAATDHTGGTTRDESRAYNGDRQLVRTTVGTNTTDLVWDNTMAVPQVLEGRTGFLWLRLNHGLELVSMQFNVGGGIQNVAVDAHRSITSTGTTKYTAHGEPVPTVTPAAQAFGYHSEFTVNGLVHLRNRDYDPTTGTFTTPDPLDGIHGTTTTANRYHYVDNNPTNLTDPLGLSPHDQDCTFVGCVIEGLNPLEAIPSIDDMRQLLEDIRKDPIGTAADIATAVADNAWDCGFDLTTGILQTATGTDEANADGNVRSGAEACRDTAAVALGAKKANTSGRSGRGGTDTNKPPTTPTRTGGVCRGNSFSASTTVLMANGERKRIDQVEEGDYVLATDPETGETGSREVIATLPHTDQLLTLRLSSGDVVTTEDHRYWNQTDQAWQESKDLDLGDELLTFSNDVVIVEGLDWSTVHTDAAYDLDVADLDTFYVEAGDESVLVHNSDCVYENPGHHDPTSPNYNSTKSMLPDNAEELFSRSVDVNGTKWAKEGTGKKAIYHRFSSDGNGNWHWSGSTAGVTSAGAPNVIQTQNVPISVRRG